VMVFIFLSGHILGSDLEDTPFSDRHHNIYFAMRKNDFLDTYKL
jgi:hypothetical protein